MFLNKELKLSWLKKVSVIPLQAFLTFYHTLAKGSLRVNGFSKNICDEMLCFSKNVCEVRVH